MYLKELLNMAYPPNLVACWGPEGLGEQIVKIVLSQKAGDFLEFLITKSVE